MDEKIDNEIRSWQKGDQISSEQAMQLAMDVAIAGAPYVSPNPVVGCVIVDQDHHFLASGYHHKYGEAHAEIDALEKLMAFELKNSIFYVTLEPCAHQGKTGSCAVKMASLLVQRVIYGMVDPNPLVAGQGAEILKFAGIEAVEYQGSLKIKLSELCEIFLKNFTTKKVFISAKVASSLDGQIALKTGESKWITSEDSRNYVHQLRSYHDGLIVGRRTVEADDPSLNIRHPTITKRTRLILLDPRGLLLTQINQGREFKFLQSHRQEDIYFAVTEKHESTFQQIVFTDLNQLMEKLWQLQFRSIFIEGGAATYSRFLQAGLIDRLYLFLAPVIIGAENGISWTHHFGINRLENKLPLFQMQTKLFGKDLLITGKLAAGSRSKDC